MSTTHIQPLPNVYGRMAYTELGEGKKRTENIQNGTNRIAAQMGDGDSREEFVRFCSAMKRQNQGRENEGFEVRVSWAPEELSKDDPEDIQRACEYGYLLCKEVAPNAPCWVTVHTDGEGGCVHVHATIANHDLETGNAIAHGTDHATVKRKNDQLSRQMGFSVVGPQPGAQRTRWADRKSEFEPGAFERMLGNRVEEARNASSSMDEFREELMLPEGMEGKLRENFYATLEKEKERRKRGVKNYEEVIRQYLSFLDESNDDISLTEIAKQYSADTPGYVIQSWMRSRNTIEFLRQWEIEENPNFDQQACDELMEKAKTSSFTLTPTQWVKKTGAVGLRVRQGKGGGVMAHPDIASDFRMWLDPSLRLALVKFMREQKNQRQ